MLIFVFLIALSWGSFLNVIAYRLAFDKPFFTKRSHCPNCYAVIAAYDNIPLLSWVLLRGVCRHCRNKISYVYPFIELLTALVMTALYIKVFYVHNMGFYEYSLESLGVFSAHALFFTGLIVAIAMDLRAMVISQLVSLWLVPVAFICAYFNFLEITFYQSILGAFLGYGILWIIAFIFKLITKKDGMGIGDMELLAMIGSFIGFFGGWVSLTLGSILGAVFGGAYLALTHKTHATRIPFGPFLGLGAIFYFFLKETIVSFLF